MSAAETPSALSPSVSPASPASPAERPSARDTWRELYGHIRPHRAAVAVGALLSLLGAATALGQPLAAKALVDRLAADGPLVGVLVLLTGLVLAGTVAEAAGAYVLERTAESVVLAARRRLMGRLIRLRIPEMERAQPGDLMSRVTSDTTLLHQVTTHSVVSAVTGTLSLAATLVMMALMDAVLLGVTLGVIGLIGSSLGFLLPRISRAAERTQEAVGAISTVLERAFGAFRTIKASGAEVRETARLEEAARDAWRHGVRSAKWQAIASSAVGFSVQASFLAVLGVGGARVASGAIEISTLIAFLLFLVHLADPVTQLVGAAEQYQMGAAAIARISAAERLGVERLDAERLGEEPGTGGAGPVEDGRERATGVPRQGGPVRPRGGPASVRFQDVGFRYRDELPLVHDGVSFVVPGGGLTAFVGPSGAGKSTVFALIERFHEVTGGRVLVDGEDVRDWPLDRLRAAIGYVEQDAPVLAGTLRENLVFAAPDATDEEIRDVLVRTRLTGLVERLPDGLESLVGHRGSQLSGGERQRVAIARALLRRPRLLLLDEATSQLDAANELALREVVAEAARHTTVLVVAHRLSTVTAADRIVVMEAGTVRAVGTHAELVASDALYGELAATQFLVATG
ncbi:ABC transporter ATP-binding protein [Streptomyces sp. NPDC001922]|uniref:ABC transporter ATP-binding protein n=1 Tax=Streptomyces sp. NPDC001922 TaxID=3364624 RepID=UPI00367D4896